jgi:pyridoxine 5-phosphate synthase
LLIIVPDFYNMTRLSVNINKVATLRNARGGNVPNVLQFALDCERFGAEGITVHPRPDERHIRYSDVFLLKEHLKTEFNIEGFPDARFLSLVKEVKPHQVTLVPDPPDVLTSNAGWDVKDHFSFLKEIISDLNQHGIRVSLFMDTDSFQIEKAAETGTQRIELYTERYASNYSNNKEQAVEDYRQAAYFAQELGIEVNAGHDLSLKNLKYLHDEIPFLKEVSIGHALISNALYYGIENTIQMYKRQLAG